MMTISEIMRKIERRATEIEMSPEELARMIDHTKLSPCVATESMRRLCAEAKTYGFYSVCVNPCWTRFCANELKGTEVKVGVAVGFPLGQTTSEVKAFEAKQATERGASEIDMVMNIAAFKDKRYNFVRDDIKTVVEAANESTVKVILETGYLTHEEISKACKIVKEAGADFVKNATGFGPLGATVPHIVLMREAVGEDFGVKASGGIKNFGDALRMIAAGANRIGASAGAEIIESCKRAKGSSPRRSPACPV